MVALREWSMSQGPSGHQWSSRVDVGTSTNIFAGDMDRGIEFCRSSWIVIRRTQFKWKDSCNISHYVQTSPAFNLPLLFTLLVIPSKKTPVVTQWTITYFVKCNFLCRFSFKSWHIWLLLKRDLCQRLRGRHIRNDV